METYILFYSNYCANCKIDIMQTSSVNKTEMQIELQNNLCFEKENEYSCGVFA